MSFVLRKRFVFLSVFYFFEIFSTASAAKTKIKTKPRTKTTEASVSQVDSSDGKKLPQKLNKSDKKSKKTKLFVAGAVLASSGYLAKQKLRSRELEGKKVEKLNKNTSAASRRLNENPPPPNENPRPPKEDPEREHESKEREDESKKLETAVENDEHKTVEELLEETVLREVRRYKSQHPGRALKPSVLVYAVLVAASAHMQIVADASAPREPSTPENRKARAEQLETPDLPVNTLFKTAALLHPWNERKGGQSDEAVQQDHLTWISTVALQIKSKPGNEGIFPEPFQGRLGYQEFLVNSRRARFPIFASFFSHLLENEMTSIAKSLDRWSEKEFLSMLRGGFVKEHTELAREIDNIAYGKDFRSFLHDCLFLFRSQTFCGGLFYIPLVPATS